MTGSEAGHSFQAPKVAFSSTRKKPPSFLWNSGSRLLCLFVSQCTRPQMELELSPSFLWDKMAYSSPYLREISPSSFQTPFWWPSCSPQPLVHSLSPPCPPIHFSCCCRTHVCARWVLWGFTSRVYFLTLLTGLLPAHHCLNCHAFWTPFQVVKGMFSTEQTKRTKTASAPIALFSLPIPAGRTGKNASSRS